MRKKNSKIVNVGFSVSVLSAFVAIFAYWGVLSLSVFSSTSAWADNPVAVPAGGAPAPVGVEPAAGGAQGFGQMILPFALMFGVMYFLMIRPQQKKMKEQQAMLGGLKHGDEILTASGILGKVTGLNDRVVTVEIADNVRVKMMKSQVSQIVKGPLKDLEVKNA